jgi:hypothetical protein
VDEYMTRQQQMLEAFAAYEKQDRATVSQHAPLMNLIGVPTGTRLLRIYRRKGHWEVWTATADFIFGTYLCLYDSGQITSVTERQDQGPETFQVRPSDEEIRNK